MLKMPTGQYEQKLPTTREEDSSLDEDTTARTLGKYLAYI